MNVPPTVFEQQAEKRYLAPPPSSLVAVTLIDCLRIHIHPRRDCIIDLRSRPRMSRTSTRIPLRQSVLVLNNKLPRPIQHGACSLQLEYIASHTGASLRSFQGLTRDKPHLSGFLTHPRVALTRPSARRRGSLGRQARASAPAVIIDSRHN